MRRFSNRIAALGAAWARQRFGVRQSPGALPQASLSMLPFPVPTSKAPGDWRTPKPTGSTSGWGFDAGRLGDCWSVGFRNSQSAFTLLELIVVIAVVALLSLTLAPGFAKSSNTKALQCINNHRQLCAAWRMYADDSRDLIVYAATGGTVSPLDQYAWTQSSLDFDPANRSNWDTNGDIVLRPLWPYTGKDASIYKCPSDRSYVVVNGENKPRVRSLAMNLYLGGFAGTDGGWPWAAPYRIYTKLPDITAPAKIFVFLDMRPDVVNWGNFMTDMRGYPNTPSQYEFADYPGFYHELGCTFSFVDGRAEIKRWRDSRTTPPPGSLISSSTPSPNNTDIAWLQDHATRPK